MIYYIIYIVSAILILLLNPCFKNDYKPRFKKERIYHLIIALLPGVNTLLLIIVFIWGVFIAIDKVRKDNVG